jgi:hypothetical protein
MDGWSILSVGLGIFVGALLVGIWNAIVPFAIGF